MSAKKRAKATFTEGTSSKRSKVSLSGCDIKTRKLFNQEFGPAYSIEVKATKDLFHKWQSEDSKKMIKSWLISCGPHFWNLISKIQRNSEGALYPLLINALLPVMELSGYTVKAAASPDTISDEQYELAAEMIAQQSREGYLHDILEATSEKTTEPALPPGILDTTDEVKVRKFLVYVEENIKSEVFPNKGRVEILVHAQDDENSPEVVVLEAKPHITNDNDEGFFQAAAYMVLKGLPFGIYTSHKAWKFLRLVEVNVAPSNSNDSTVQPKFIIQHSEIFDLVKTSYSELDQQALDIYAILLEIFDVPVDGDLKDAKVVSDKAMDERGIAFTKTIA